MDGEESCAFKAKPRDAPFFNLGSREMHHVLVFLFIMGLEIGQELELECCIWMSCFCMFGYQQIRYYSSWSIKKLNWSKVISPGNEHYFNKETHSNT